MEERGEVLLGPQPFVNGTISDKQDPDAGYPQDEYGNPLEPEPWEGDEAHEVEASTKYGRRSVFKLRRLDAVVNTNATGGNETVLEVIEEDLEAAWESVVEGFDWMFSSIVHVFLGDNTTKVAPHVTQTAAEPAVDVSTEDHTGIKYIEAGLMVDVAAWTNDDFSGKQTMITAGNAANMDHVVNSFFLVSKKYHANKVKPEGGYQDITEQPEVPQMDMEASKVIKIAKKMEKKEDYKNMRSKSARRAAMMRHS